MQARTLIASEYMAKERAHFALSHEFCRIIQEADDAHIVAPGLDHYISRNLGRFLPPHETHNVQRDFNRLVNGVRKGLGLKNMAVVEPVSLTQDYELFIYIAWSPQSLVELSRIREWRKRCKTAVLYMFELWSSSIEQDAAYLKLIDEFDFVFMLHNESVPLLRNYTKTPGAFLLTGIDALTFAPVAQPNRSVDVYSIGNRAPVVHRQLVKRSREQDFFYIYDTLASTDSAVRDWTEHRILMSNVIKRSRYFICYNPASLNGDKAARVGGEQVVPSRLFEGAAGGAVLLGTAPECAEYYDNFDWPGAVVSLPPDSTDVAERLRELDADQDRLDRIRQDNVVNCLLRHDWIYRWEAMLSAIGMRPREGAARRKAALLEVAKEKAGRRAFLSLA